MDKQDRVREWVYAAAESELMKIHNMSNDSKLNVPNSEYWQSMLKLASITKNGIIQPTEMLQNIIDASQHLRTNDKRIRYTFYRALRMAKIRRPKGIT